MILSTYWTRLGRHLATVEFNDDEIADAVKRRSSKDKYVGKNKFESGQRWMGYLGEVAYRRFLDSFGHIDYIYHNIANGKDSHDFTVDGKNGKELRVDVKTTVRRRPPKDNDKAVVPEEQIDNPYNYLVFISYDPIEKVAYILGGMNKHNFKMTAEYMQEGQIDPVNNFKAIHSMYRTEVKKLDRFSTNHIY